MRLSLIILSLLIVSSASYVQARVLLPESHGGTTTTTPNLGLNPTLRAPVKKAAPIKATPTVLAPTKTEITTLRPVPQIKRTETPKPQAITPRKLQAVSKDDLKQDILNNFDKYIPDSVKKNLPSNYKEYFQKQIKNMDVSDKKYDFRQESTAGQKINITPGGIVPEKILTQKELLIQKYKNRALSMKEYRQKQQIDQMVAMKNKMMDKKLSRPPTYIDDIPIIKTYQKDLKKKLTIASMPNYIWGKRGIERIIRTLGYKRKEIPNNCQIRHAVTIETDSDLGAYTDILWGGYSTSIKYDGDIESVKFRSLAVCNPPQKEATRGGIITKVGDKQGITLPGNGECKPTGMYVTRLTTKYIGDGQVQCAYK